MHWVVQNNMFKEDSFKTLMSTIERLELPYSLVKVIPFVGELQPDVNPTGKVVVMGSYTMSDVALRKGWKPGSWLDNLDYEVQRPRWGTNMFNHDAVISRFGDVETWVHPKFIRPTKDCKSFTGQVMDWGNFQEWRNRVLALSPEDNPMITRDTKIMVCSVKKIYSETRVWIVKGYPITASEYKRGRRVLYSSQVVQPFVPFFLSCAARRSSIFSANHLTSSLIYNPLKNPQRGSINLSLFSSLLN